MSVPVVWLISNGDYWKAVWTDERGERRSRSIGAKGKLSARQARLKCRDLGIEIENTVATSKMRIGEWLTMYQSLRSDVKKSTRSSYAEAVRYLTAFLGDDPPIDSLTRADAAEWYAAMAGGKLTQKLNELYPDRKPPFRIPSLSTMRRHVRALKLIFGEAVNQDRILFNPFDRLKGAPPKVIKDWRQISREELASICEKCPDESWRLLFALARLSGLRLGEGLGLRWADVDFAGNRMRVNWRVTEETTKKRRRICPIEPARCPSGLLAMLRAAHGGVPRGSLVCHGIDANNVRRNALAILEASVGVYAKPFHTLRKNCEGDWAACYPQHVVSDWIGHDMVVSQDHYLRVPEELYALPQSVQIGHDEVVKQ